MRKQSSFIFATLLFCCMSWLAGCGGDSATTRPGAGVLIHQGSTSLLYSDLSNYSIGFPETSQLEAAAVTKGQPATTLALGLTAGEREVLNLEVIAELFIPGDTRGYRLFMSPDRGNDTLTVDLIRAGQEAHLTLPLYLGTQAVERLKKLNEETECILKITIDPYSKQSSGPLANRERSITVAYLPPSIFDPLPLPSAFRPTPPYSNRYFNTNYDETWGAKSILAAHLDYMLRGTWEPTDALPNIPYAVGLECGAHVSLNIFGSSKSLLRGDFLANMNSQAIPNSGGKAYLQVFDTVYFDKQYFLESASKPIEWNPVINGTIPKQERPYRMDINLGGGVVVTLLSEIEGTWEMGFPGSLSLAGKPWLLQQAFTPDVKTRLVSTIKSPSTRYGLVAPMQLLDVIMRARLDNMQIDTSVPRAHGEIQWPADVTLLKGELYLTDKYYPKWKWKIYEYAIFDKTYRLAQAGLIHASRNGVNVVPPELIEEPRKW